MEEEKIPQNLTDENEVAYTERKRLLFFGLPWTFTKYTVTPGLLTTNRGLFNTVEDDCYMYKIQDVKLTATLIERIFGLATLICYTGDVTDPELQLVHIKNAKEIKSYLLNASEAARLKRRTMSTIDISARGADADSGEMPDF